ncbi:MAG: efflux RND transporter periplasmic adaptor subunit [Candidatus Auribacter fodinae]|jgi:RND family efflux transporter MFP subunit|uniref:Efflux RND transporter periplasmic adaptor subunit n=1 Tax=Candidatus Auribacter fodinae TaxID=2093366 RepID=A0A3A4R8K7_9BACT|nr:MAG: efflux RND transporter periplasmic adaptor subunit [Candidatus Auribacter fodinae]
MRYFLKKKKNGVLLVCSAAVFLAVGCGKKEEPQQEKVVRPVKTILLKEDSTVTREYPGRVQASDRVDLSFRVSGPLIELPVNQGDYVEAGQLVARIDPRDFEVAEKEAQAVFAKAQADLKRYQALFEKDAVPAAELDQKQSEYDVAKAKLDAATDNLEYTYLRAPFSGHVGEKYTENFQLVQAKQPVIRFNNIAVLEIVIDLPENEVAILKMETAKDFVASFDSAPGRTFPLEFVEFNVNADSKTQTFAATFRMPQPENLNVLPGMTARVTRKSVRAQGLTAHILLPGYAIASDESGNPFVWIVDEALTVHKRPVKLGEATGSESVVIIEGLTAGERVVLTGVTLLREGDKIRLLNSEQEG